MHDYFLIRYFDLSEDGESYKDDVGNIKIKYLYSPDERLQDLSTSLFGHYNVEHAKLKLTKKGMQDGYAEYCAPNEVVEPPTPTLHFEIDELRRCWFINIQEILNINDKKVSKNNVDVDVQPFVTHSSTRSNFWHFSIRWIVDGNDLYTDTVTTKTQKVKISQRIGHLCRTLMMSLASDDIPDSPLLPEEEYKLAL